MAIWTDSAGRCWYIADNLYTTTSSATTSNIIWYPATSTTATTGGAWPYAQTWVDPYQGMWARQYYEQGWAQTQQALTQQLAQQQAQQQPLYENVEGLHAINAEARRNEEERQRAYSTEHQKQLDAEKRARDLLLDHLTPEQKASIEAHKWFVVEGKSGSIYRIRTHGASGNIDVLRKSNLERPTHRLCAHIPYTARVPLSDQLLAQKLMLENDEKAFLKIANRQAA